MRLVANGQDGNGLRLENFWQCFHVFARVQSRVETDFGQIFLSKFI